MAGAADVAGAAGWADTAQAVIALRGVAVRRGETFLVREIDWTVAPGQRWVVLGANGAGKTTLLNLASAQLLPTVGMVSVLGERLGSTDAAALRTRIGVTTGGLATRIPPEERVRDVVLTASWGVLGRFNEQYEAVDESRAIDLLEQFGVAALADRAYATLSEGERKRVQIARALMTDPELLLLDEPAAGLDLGARESLVRLLAELAADPDAPAIVLVTHHVEEIPPGFSHAMLLRDGGVVAAGEIGETITDELLSKTFDCQLRVVGQDGRFWARAA